MTATPPVVHYVTCCGDCTFGNYGDERPDWICVADPENPRDLLFKNRRDAWRDPPPDDCPLRTAPVLVQLREKGPTT